MTLNTKEILLESGYKMFSERGYNGAGLNDILKEADVPKGSFYHYFENKEMFLLGVLQGYRRRASTLMAPYLEDKEVNAIERFKSYLQQMISLYDDTECKGGCFFGTVAMEMSGGSDLIREDVREGMALWQAGIEKFFIDGQEEGLVSSDICTKELATLFVDGWQGALMRMKLDKSTKALEAFLNSFLKILSA